MAALQPSRSAALAGKVYRASQLFDAQERAGVHRVLPVVSALRPLLPGQGLRRGATIAVRRPATAARLATMDGQSSTVEGPVMGEARFGEGWPGEARPTDARPGEARAGGGRPATRLTAGRRAGSRPAGRQGATLALAAQPEGLHSGGAQSGEPVAATSLLLALLAEASQAGSWCAVVGVPTLGAVAAAELGIALDRLALVPYPGPEWAAVVAALLDGMDMVVAAPPGPVAPTVASRLAARARQRGSVLVPYLAGSTWDGRWTGPMSSSESVRGVWEGLGQGRGPAARARGDRRRAGRGAAARPKQVRIWLPGARRWSPRRRRDCRRPADRARRPCRPGCAGEVGSRGVGPARSRSRGRCPWVVPARSTRRSDRGRRRCGRCCVVPGLAGDRRRDRRGGARARAGRGAARQPGARLLAGGPGRGGPPRAAQAGGAGPLPRS